ncbi:MAG: hypothetical protein U0Z75_02635 [Deinococcaceae bacterium]
MRSNQLSYSRSDERLGYYQVRMPTVNMRMQNPSIVSQQTMVGVGIPL